MKITILTLFPQIFEGFFTSSIFARAVNKNLVEYNFINFRDFATDSYKKVDDEPFGGGAGMLLKPEPLFKALDSISAISKRVILPTPSGKRFNQSYARELSKEDELIFISAHYEGVDQRVIDKYVKDEICIGDYVISSGEVATMVIIDAVYRLLDSVIKKESLEEESFNDNLLEYPQYTRPAVYEGMSVPDVLLSGNHAQIKKWREIERIRKTYNFRKDLLSNAILSKEQKKILADIAENS